MELPLKRLRPHVTSRGCGRQHSQFPIATCQLGGGGTGSPQIAQISQIQEMEDKRGIRAHGRIAYLPDRSFDKLRMTWSEGIAIREVLRLARTHRYPLRLTPQSVILSLSKDRLRCFLSRSDEIVSMEKASGFPPKKIGVNLRNLRTSPSTPPNWQSQ